MTLILEGLMKLYSEKSNYSFNEFLTPAGGSWPKKKGRVMSQSTSSSSSGIGFTGLLTICFIVLKLLDKISWSWWWVLSPIWISFSIVIAILLGIAIIAIIKD